MSVQNLLAIVRSDGHGKQNRLAQTGAELIWEVSDRSDRYVHILFPPIEEKPLATPFSVQSIYRACNGLSIYQSSLEISGIRGSYSRHGDAIYQPYSFQDANSYERPRKTPKNWVVVGAYLRHGETVVVSDQGVVRVCDRDDFMKIVAEWSSLDSFFNSEGDRLRTAWMAS